jgi:hypothetical protein
MLLPETHSLRKNKWNGFEAIFVEFWHELKAPFGPVAAVEVHAPSCWSSKFFLELFLKDLGKHGIISLVNTYYINGCEYRFNTINTLHHLFQVNPV